MSKSIDILYSSPFPSTRTGALFNAFSYPTKISPEAEAIFIACHSNIGDTIFDPFGGSGTTGIATMLTDSPTESMLKKVKELGLEPIWGPRKAVVYELSPVGCLLGRAMCSTKSVIFKKYTETLLKVTSDICNEVYSIVDPEGNIGLLRHAIWSDIVVCPHCGMEIPYAQLAVQDNPLTFKEDSLCPHCGESVHLADAERVKETVNDPLLHREISVKKRRLYKLYGITGKKRWSRYATENDQTSYNSTMANRDITSSPIYPIKWGELYRQGYNYGITHLHHFYTSRNWFVFNTLWSQISQYPEDIRDALKIFLLSYNSAHSTLMTRVVAKKNNPDFVITGAQPGVLYISGLPVEKNILFGLQRKLKTFVEAFEKIESSKGEVQFVNGSSTNVLLEDNSVDYVFTDPPFGDFIPYSEINQLNEAWMGIVTDDAEEAIINPAQGKAIEEYSNLMTAVFGQISRIMKPAASCTLVFHSAKSVIWRALVDAYKEAGLSSIKASILDKVQPSFKQTNSSVTVKGDPLILLKKENENVQYNESFQDDKELAKYLVEQAPMPYNKDVAVKTFSKYIMMCIEHNFVITLDAKYFFEYAS